MTDLYGSSKLKRFVVRQGLNPATDLRCLDFGLLCCHDACSRVTHGIDRIARIGSVDRIDRVGRAVGVVRGRGHADQWDSRSALCVPGSTMSLWSAVLELVDDELHNRAYTNQTGSTKVHAGFDNCQDSQFGADYVRLAARCHKKREEGIKGEVLTSRICREAFVQSKEQHRADD